MKDFFEFLGIAAAWIGLRLAALAWWLIKLALLAAIVIGVGTEVLNLAPKVWPPFEFGLSAFVTYATLGFLTAVDAWWILAVAFVLVSIWGTRAAVERIEKHVGESKIALVALGNYFKIEVETETMKVIREEGLKGFMRLGKENVFLSAIFGFDFDDRLTARPVRWGASVSFHDDVRQALKEVPEART